MVSNRKLAEMFAGGARRGRGSNMFIEGDAIYSYGHHFPIAVRRGRNADYDYDFNEDRYSHSTTVHKSRVRGVLKGRIFSSNTGGLMERIRKMVR